MPTPAGTPSETLPARLRVGVVGPGRVGTALATALGLAGHQVVALSAGSGPSRGDSGVFSQVPVRQPDEVIAAADLTLLTVPDDALPGLVVGLAATGADRHAVVLALAEEIDGLQQADRRRMAMYESAARPYMEECRAAGIDMLQLREAHDRMVEIAGRLLPLAPTPGSPDADAQ